MTHASNFGTKSKNNSTAAIIIIGLLFFIFGFVTWLNGTLIPYLKLACELNNFQSLLVAFAFYIAYFVMALPMSDILKRTGLKKGMSLGLIIMACGAGIFIPAATYRNYWMFLLGLFVTGTGLTLLQTAANPYVTIVGPIESAAKRISIMGICNKVAGVIAPIIMGAIILKDADALKQQLTTLDETARNLQLDALSQRAVTPYLFMLGALLVLAIWIHFSPLPNIEEENNEKGSDKFLETLSHPQLSLGVLALFLYVGAEVIAADTIGLFGESENIPLSEARNFPSFTLSSMVIGYLVGIFFIPKKISQSRALAISAITGILFTMLALSTSGYISVMFIALLGLANALMWPAIWPLALQDLGSHVKKGSALLIMAIAGGATLPLLYGKMADMDIIGRKGAYLILIPCYLFILYYSLYGHLKRKKISH